ncbi:MAG: hypothetical protein HY788_12615 [Deltaproteobacteria bacterium]|nr:hypothetical protein [Deltaproteobacteria bacterium]
MAATKSALLSKYSFHRDAHYMTQGSRSDRHLLTHTGTSTSYFTIGFFVLSIYLSLRPVFAMDLDLHLGIFTFKEAFALFGSFFLVLLAIGKIKFGPFHLLVFFFVLYYILTLFYGGHLRETARQILPFVCFFATAAMLTSRDHIRIIILFMLITYVSVIWLNAYYIYKGVTVGMVIYWTGLERYKGLFESIHAMAHTMLVYSFLLALYLLVRKPAIRAFSHVYRLLLILSLLSSMYCIYKSATRTAILGFLIFWIIFLFGYSKKLLFLFCTLLILISVIQYGAVRTIFWDVFRAAESRSEKIKDMAGGGRIHLWKTNLAFFSRLGLASKIAGIGLGNEGSRGTSVYGRIPESHNDLLTLLIGLGVTGLGIYLMMMCILFLHIVRLRMAPQFKYFGVAVLTSVLFMNFVSNSYITRVELAQLFWFLMGIYYIKDVSSVLQKA